MWGGAGCPSGWMELTAHRTLALREAVGRSPDVASTMLLLKLVNDTFRTSSSAGNCLEASVLHVYISAQTSDQKDSVAAKLVDERHTEWEADLSLGDDAALLDYLTSLDQGGRLSLLAHCLSFGINALHEKVNAYRAGISASGLTRRMAQAHLLALAAGLDMDDLVHAPPGGVGQIILQQIVAVGDGGHVPRRIVRQGIVLEPAVVRARPVPQVDVAVDDAKIAVHRASPSGLAAR